MIMGIGQFSLHCKQSNFVEPNLVSYENKRITKAIQIIYVVSSPFSAVQDIALIYVIDICTREASFESSLVIRYASSSTLFCHFQRFFFYALSVDEEEAQQRKHIKPAAVNSFAVVLF